MAGLTRRRKPCGHMIGIRRALVIRFVTRVAICRRSSKVPVNVAICAGYIHMHSR